MGELPPQKRLSLRRTAMVESIGSSMRIEGSAITDPAVEQVLSRLSMSPEGSFSTKDEQQAAGYAQLMEKIFSSWRDIPFTASPIRQMHRDLFAFSEKDAWHRGHYKTLPSSSDTAVNGDARTIRDWHRHWHRFSGHNLSGDATSCVRTDGMVEG